MNNDEVTAAIGAALLKTISNALNHWSMLLALAAILLLGLKAVNGFLITSVLVALLQGYFALRTAFDAAVFAALGGAVSHYESFDRLLTRWKLRGANITTRCLDERLQGAMRLLRWQAVSFLAQIILLLMDLVSQLNTP